VLAARTVETLTAALIHTEAAADQAGWDATPALIGLFDRTVTSRDHNIEIDPFPLDAATWQIPDPQRPGQNLPVPVVLQAITDTLASPAAPAWLRDWLRERGRTLIGFGFLCEGWVTSGYPGYRPGDLNAVPAMADAEVRILTACDTDGHFYQVTRERGANTPTVIVLTQPTPSIRATTVTNALYRLTAFADHR
jgi:hypothetical protein